MLALLSALATVLPIQIERETSQLLLALRFQGDPPQYQTVYAITSGEHALTVWTGPDVIVPRDGLLWRAQVVRRVAGDRNQVVEDTFWFGTLESSPMLEPVDLTGCEETVLGESSTTVEIVFLSPDHVGLRESAWGTCGAHAGGGSTLSMRQLPDGGPLDLLEIFGDSVRPALTSAVERTLWYTRLSEECYELRETHKWALLRDRQNDVPEFEHPDFQDAEIDQLFDASRFDRGSWHVVAQLDPKMHVCGSVSFEFGVDASPPIALTGHDGLPVPFSEIARRNPAVYDAVASPSGDLMVLVGESLRFVRTDATLDRATELAQLACPSLHCGELVMVQWFSGVPYWHDAIVKILQKQPESD